MKDKKLRKELMRRHIIEKINVKGEPIIAYNIMHQAKLLEALLEYLNVKVQYTNELKNPMFKIEIKIVKKLDE